MFFQEQDKIPCVILSHLLWASGLIFLKILLYFILVIMFTYIHHIYTCIYINSYFHNISVIDYMQKVKKPFLIIFITQ